MKKCSGILCLILVIILGLGTFTACGDKEDKKVRSPKKAERKIVLVNNTGNDLKGKLLVRSEHRKKWRQLDSSSSTWKDGEKLELKVTGNMPKAKDGWDVKLLYADSEEFDIWSGVPLDSAKAISITKDGVSVPMKK